MKREHEIIISVDGTEIEDALQKIKRLKPGFLKHICYLILKRFPVIKIDAESNAAIGTGNLLLRLRCAEFFLKLISAFGAG